MDEKAAQAHPESFSEQRFGSPKDGAETLYSLWEQDREQARKSPEGAIFKLIARKRDPWEWGAKKSSPSVVLDKHIYFRFTFKEETPTHSQETCYESVIQKILGEKVNN